MNELLNNEWDKEFNQENPEEFFEWVEMNASRLEITCDYFLEEFYLG